MKDCEEGKAEWTEVLNPVFQEEGTYQSTYKETEKDQSELWRKLNQLLKKTKKLFKREKVFKIDKFSEKAS